MSLPQDDPTLRDLLDSVLDDVPLDKAEQQAAVRETGIDVDRLVARIRARVHSAQDETAHQNRAE